MLHATSRATRIALGVSVITAVAFAPTIQAQKSGSSPNYELASAWTSQKVSKLVFDTCGHSSMAGDERSVLVHVSDSRRTPFSYRRPCEADEGRALRSRQGGGGTHHDHAHPLRRAAPAVHAGSLHQGGFGIRIRSAGASRREHRDDQAKAHHHRATAGEGGLGAGSPGSGLGTRKPETKSCHCSKGSGAGAPERGRHPTRGRKRSISNTTWRRRR